MEKIANRNGSAPRALTVVAWLWLVKAGLSSALLLFATFATATVRGHGWVLAFALELATLWVALQLIHRNPRGLRPAWVLCGLIGLVSAIASLQGSWLASRDLLLAAVTLGLITRVRVQPNRRRPDLARHAPHRA